MKIIHIITGLNDGGAEGALYRLCKHDKQNCHVVISLMDGGKYGSLLSAENVPVHCIELSKGMFNLSKFIKLIRVIKAEKPEVAQTWMYHADLLGGIAAKVAGVKNVFWGVRHSNLTPGTVKRSTILIAKLCGILSYFIPKRIICCADNAVKSHIQAGYAAKKFITIPNGYCLDEYKPGMDVSLLDTELGISNEFLMAMVGRFDPQKDHGNLISSLTIVKKKYPSFKCLLVGANMTTDNETLMSLIEASGCLDNIILLGRRTDIPVIMNRIDIHVLSSLGEAFPNVLAEAMACGTPCVTTDVGDASFIVGNTGWVVSAQNSKKLAQTLLVAINEMHSDRSKWRNRKVSARNRVEKEFNISVMVNRYKSVWETQYN